MTLHQLQIHRTPILTLPQHLAARIAAGTATLSGDTLGTLTPFVGAQGNSALGGFRSTAGDGYGGAVYVAGGSVTLTNDTITHNEAGGYHGGAYQQGYGGGIFIGTNAKVYLDSFSVAQTKSNTAGQFPNIDGTYILLT